MENRPTRGTGSYLGLVVMAILIFMFFSPLLRNSFSSGDDVYTMEKFAQDLKENKVTRVEVTPNRDNDTGYAAITLSDGDKEILYATVISDLEEMSRKSNVVTVVRDVPSEGTFMTVILPMLLVMGICFFFFYMMTGQSMGGGNAMPKNNSATSPEERDAKTETDQDDTSTQQTETTAYTTETLVICGISLGILAVGLCVALAYRRRP